MSIEFTPSRGITRDRMAVPPFDVPGEHTQTKRALAHVCQRCKRRFEHGFTPRCPSCTGLVEVEDDLDAVRIYEANTVSAPFVDLLPLRSPGNFVFLGEGGTPCVHAGRLGESIGLERLYVKIESRNPTGTTKDRMAAVLLSPFRELGLYEFTSSSTGNSSSALARGIQLNPGYMMHLYIGGDFADRVQYHAGNPGVAVHALHGFSFSDAFNFAKAEAQRRRLPFEGGFFNPARREGLKLAFFEAVEQIPSPIDWYVQAVSSAMGVYGTWKGARELLALKLITVLPRLLCVQQETCCPMVRAFEEGASEIDERHIVQSPTGIAKAILRGTPAVAIRTYTNACGIAEGR